MTAPISTHPLTPERWPDFERLFGASGGYGSCWCTYFRMRSSRFAAARGEERKAAMRSLVESGAPPGLLLYVDREPAAWASFDRRDRYPMLQHSRVYTPIDSRPVWTIVCFVVGRRFRRQGMMGRLLEAAIKRVRAEGGRVLEAYPVEPGAELKRYEGYMGIRSVFDRAGFKEVARLKNGRPVMRLELPPAPALPPDVR